MKKTTTKNFFQKVMTAIVPFFIFALVIAVAVPEKTIAAEIHIDTYKVQVDSGYLALRNAMEFDSANEIGQLENGDTVRVVDHANDGDYWYVYSIQLDKYGYVNHNYLVEWGEAVDGPYTALGSARIMTGTNSYVPLCTAAYDDSRSTIGKLYSDEIVRIVDQNGNTYWYVYVPEIDTYGYVDKAYLGRYNR